MFDSQTFTVAVDSDDDVFSLADRAELNSVVSRIAPDGLEARRAAERRLRIDLMQQTTADGKAAVARGWLEGNNLMTDDDVAAITRLRDKAHHVKTASMDAGAYQRLMGIVADGLITSEEATKRVGEEQARARREAFTLANELIMVEASIQRRLETVGDLVSDDGKAKAIEEFEKDNEWEKAKERFKELYDSLDSFEAKGELCGRHPLLAKAVFGR